MQQAYRKCRRADKHTQIVIWVDIDIYVRNEGAVEERNAKGYAHKGELPDFLFSVMNFEDFLGGRDSSAPIGMVLKIFPGFWRVGGNMVKYGRLKGKWK